MRYRELFIGFLRSGLLCFGGGPASIPFFHREAVVRYKWMSDEEFGEIVAIGNTLPGPINTKMSGYIGFRVGGIPGLLISVTASMLPTAILMIILMATLSHFSDQPWARGMSSAMVPVVGVILGIMAWQFLTLAAKSLKWHVTLIHVVIVGAVIWFLNVHPAFILVALFAWAIFGHKITGVFKPDKKENE